MLYSPCKRLKRLQGVFINVNDDFFLSLLSSRIAIFASDGCSFDEIKDILKNLCPDYIRTLPISKIRTLAYNFYSYKWNESYNECDEKFIFKIYDPFFKSLPLPDYVYNR